MVFGKLTRSNSCSFATSSAISLASHSDKVAQVSDKGESLDDVQTDEISNEDADGQSLEVWVSHCVEQRTKNEL